jgi:predicted DNA-binding ArsR family transcriptional regulator|tara:strand:- start:491 stop:763 length:273 start_codon:yes stop_codon:yes gene_type:complete
VVVELVFLQIFQDLAQVMPEAVVADLVVIKEVEELIQVLLLEEETEVLQLQLQDLQIQQELLIPVVEVVEQAVVLEAQGLTMDLLVVQVL